MYLKSTSQQWRIQITYLRDSYQTQTKKDFASNFFIKMKSWFIIVCIIVQTQAWQCSMSKNTHNIHKKIAWPKIICLDSKHNNFEWLLQLALDWYNLLSISKWKWKSDAVHKSQLWVASSSTKSKASSLVTQSTWDTCTILVKAIQKSQPVQNLKKSPYSGTSLHRICWHVPATPAC